jgi:hypothetical protein
MRRSYLIRLRPSSKILMVALSLFVTNSIKRLCREVFSDSGLWNTRCFLGGLCLLLPGPVFISIYNIIYLNGICKPKEINKDSPEG